MFSTGEQSSGVVTQTPTTFGPDGWSLDLRVQSDALAGTVPITSNEPPRTDLSPTYHQPTSTSYGGNVGGELGLSYYQQGRHAWFGRIAGYLQYYWSNRAAILSCDHDSCVEDYPTDDADLMRAGGIIEGGRRFTIRNLPELRRNHESSVNIILSTGLRLGWFGQVGEGNIFISNRGFLGINMPDIAFRASAGLIFRLPNTERFTGLISLTYERLLTHEESAETSRHGEDIEIYLPANSLTIGLGTNFDI